MSRTTEMRLIELMTLKQDISLVLEYLGRKENFQFQTKTHTVDSKNGKKPSEESSTDRTLFDGLQQARVFLNVPDRTDSKGCTKPTEKEREDAEKLLEQVEELKARVTSVINESKRINDAYNEAQAFSNLKSSYSELEHLSFLSLRIGKIDPSLFDALRDAVGTRAVVVPLGDDKSHILAASSKKGRFALDTELKQFGFIALEIPPDFKGIPDDILASLKVQNEKFSEKVDEITRERNNFADVHKDLLLALLGAFSISVQINDTAAKLESTELVYRLTGWIPARDCPAMMKDLEKVTDGRIAIREYLPSEVPSVIDGREQVPVKLHHSKFVSSFERLIFSYGSPVYGSIDPTPFVAIFFTLLFGIMFGDCGQGLVILILGILLKRNIIKAGGYNRSATVFIAVGASSMVMGLLTGEFFSTEKLLEPFAMWVTGFFGTPHAPIVKLMPSASNTTAMFAMFGIAVGIGFIINTLGLIINIVNKFNTRKWGEALFGKTGLAGACFFWYVIAMVIRIALFHHTIALYDWIIIAVTLFFAGFGEIFERLVDHKRPVFKDEKGITLITGIVELIEVVSNYFSNTLSFLRVGAFALAHAVLDFVILLMTKMSGPVGGIFVMLIGNAIVVVLEGMIVAIQVVRLHYYEFFSKFFNETGTEFKPFKFEYGRKIA